jgi:uncharacterized protein involved in exopolysaccharide biosynthesis
MKSPVLLRWLGITFVVFAITLWAGKYLIENVLPKTYAATAQIEISRRMEARSLSGLVETAEPQAEILILQSNDVLYPVIQNLGLDKTWAKRVYKFNKDQLPPQVALDYMRKILKIEQVRDPTIIKITASSDDPQEAADIANELADEYKTKRDRDEDERIIRGMASLREQIAEQEKVVGKDQTALDQMKTESSPASADAKRRLDEEQAVLEALNQKLKQDDSYNKLPARIISRAKVPEYPSKPDKAFCYMATVGVAALVSVVVGCFVEVIMLFCRAGQAEKT